jgi:hypothetical protein
MFVSITLLAGVEVKCIGDVKMVAHATGWKLEVKYGMEVTHLLTSMKVARWTMAQCVYPLMDDFS